MCDHVGHTTFHVRHDAPQDSTGYPLAVTEHGFAANIRCRRNDIFPPGQQAGQVLPVGKLPGKGGNTGVRCHTQDAVTQLALEAVHHGQHGNQGRDAQGNAEHGNEGDKGYKVRTPFGMRIAQTDIQLIRAVHAGCPC